MKLYYSDPNVVIYHGDCREVLPKFSGFYQHCVTDPPYGISKEYGEEADSWRPDRETWKLVYEALKEDGSLHLTVSNRHLPYWISEVEAAGFNYLHTSVYYNQTRLGGNWGGQFAYAWEPLLSFSKQPGFKLARRMMSDVFGHAGYRVTDHPAERALGIWQQLISLLPEGLILDPFVGSGTTLRAAKDLGRKAVGIEREEKWCRVAADRCAQEVLFNLEVP